MRPPRWAVLAAVLVLSAAVSFTVVTLLEARACSTLADQLGVPTRFQALGGGCYVRQGPDLWVPEAWLHFNPKAPR